MNTLQKSLAELIDETLAEIETLKKSDRYSAHEVELGEAKANGSMDASVEKAEDDEDEEEDKAEKAEAEADEDDEDEEDSMSKAEDDCSKAEEACTKAMKKYEMCKAEADHKKKMLAMKKGEFPKKDEKDEDKKSESKDEDKDLKKSIDARVAPLESKLADVLAAVKRLADAPVAARGTSYRSVQPLAKSQDVEPLNKTAVFNKLFDLKKSGTTIPTEEFIELESGTVTPEYIANKYGIK